MLKLAALWIDTSLRGHRIEDRVTAMRQRAVLTGCAGLLGSHLADRLLDAADAFLATKINYSNQIANLCELVGACAGQVLSVIGAGHGIGFAFLSPGIGWGGSCFGQDVAPLVATKAMDLDAGLTVRPTEIVGQG